MADIEFDTTQRDLTLAERGLDFADAAKVFAEPVLTWPDTRRDYGEERFISYGKLAGRAVVIVWTRRGEARRIISMRKANDREIEKHESSLG